MSAFTKNVNDLWLGIKKTVGLGKFMRYDAYNTYILVIFTTVLIAEKEYGIKVARLAMEWFDIDNLESIDEFKNVIKQDKFLADGDRSNILKSILRVKITGTDVDNFENYLSSSQWFAAMVFVNPSYLNRDLGSIDDSALFPTNITRERTESYLANPTKLATFQSSVALIKSIPFIWNNAIKLHLIGVTTSMIWYSNDPVWGREHENMWVKGNKSKLWIERKARLNIEPGESFNKGGMF